MCAAAGNAAIIRIPLVCLKQPYISVLAVDAQQCAGMIIFHESAIKITVLVFAPQHGGETAGRRNDVTVILWPVWRSGSVVRHKNEVTLRRARLVLGWVTVFAFGSVSSLRGC